MWENRSSGEKIVMLFIGFVLASAVIQSLSQIIGPLIILALLVWFANSTRENNDEQGRRVQERYDSRRGVPPPQEAPRRANADTVHAHAMAAVRRAGLDPGRIQVLPVDIGLMSLRNDDNPVIHRTWPVDDDSDYIQPFVQLRVPQVAVGKVRFELLDRYRQVVFVHEDRYELKRGRNLIIPAARMPLHEEQNLEGRWEMRVHADGVLLASHEFSWEASEAPGFERHIGEDGEINSELRAVLAESRLQQMSLDDLLAHQDDEEQQARN